MDFFLWSKNSHSRNTSTFKHEPVQPFLLVSFLEHAQAEVFIDVGANVGLYSLFATTVDSIGEVLSFEPDCNAHKELEKNISLNGLERLICPKNMAVSDKAGTLTFGTHAPMSGVNGALGTSIHDKKLFAHITKVQSTSLDHYSHLVGKVIGIKVDVEGHELSVLKGALKLLENSPCIIQIEHFLGQEIDKLLNSIGYFCFFAAGHDFYFTNINNFSNPFYIQQSLQFAIACFVDSKAGRWPNKKTIKGSLSLDVKESKNRVNVKVNVDDYFFSSSLEFAFYLIEDGKKVNVVDYCSIDHASFFVNRCCDTVEIKAFVREASNLQKKTATSYFVKRPPHGYLPAPAHENAFGSIIFRAASLINTRMSFADYYEVDTECVYQHIRIEGCRSIVELGSTLECISLRPLGVTVHTTYGTHLDIVKSGNVETVSSLESISTKRYLRNADVLIVRSQFLNRLGCDWNQLIDFFANVPRNCKIYTDLFVDLIFKEWLDELLEKSNLTVFWLVPKSNLFQKYGVDYHVKESKHYLHSAAPRYRGDSSLTVRQTSLETILQKSHEFDGACSGDRFLIDTLGLKYSSDSGLHLIDLRRGGGSSTKGYQIESKKRFSGLDTKKLLLVLCDDMQTAHKAIFESGHSFVIESVCVDTGIIIYQNPNNERTDSELDYF